MTDVSDRYRALAAGFTKRVEAVPDDRWDAQSPCEDWTARDVVRHMVEVSGTFFGLIGRELASGPSVEDDPAGAWANARDAVQAALDDPSVATTEYEGQLGRSTFEQGINRFVCADVLVHSWDLARATGGDERLDPDEVHRVYQELKPMDEMLRNPRAFGAKVDAPPGADEQSQLLAFLGRRV